MGSCIILRNSILIASSLARIRFLIVLRPMTNEPHLRDRVQKCVKPRKSKVSGKEHGRIFPPKRTRRPDLLQPVSVSYAKSRRTVLQQDQQCRRVATRYDKLSANYLAFIKLASIRIWLRANESTPQLENALEHDDGERAASALHIILLARMGSVLDQHADAYGS